NTMTPGRQQFWRNEKVRQGNAVTASRLGGDFPRAVPRPNVLGVSLILLTIPNYRQTQQQIIWLHLLLSDEDGLFVHCIFFPCNLMVDSGTSAGISMTATKNDKS